MSELAVHIQNNTGRITLQRPQALNALSMKMCHDIYDALRQWSEDDDIRQIIIDAEGEKAFCAGGDVATLHHMGRAGRTDEINAFWREEYRMNSFIAHYPKPIIALMQGYIMGGGVGIGGHASHRVVAETSRLAMPECAIGLIPDVGGSHLLAQAPGHIGEYMGVTGARIGADDIIYTGFGDYIIDETHWPDLITTICEENDLSVLDAMMRPASEQSELRSHQAEINRLFGCADKDQFADLLGQTSTDFADKVRTGMSRGSPLSMAAIFPLIRFARTHNSVDRALEYEFRFTSRAIEQADFLEGVRAVLVDKDHNPGWMHKTVSDVPADFIDSLFSPTDFHLAPVSA